MGVFTISLGALMLSLLIGAVAIYVLANKAGRGVVARLSGLLAALAGVGVYAFGRDVLPPTTKRYDEALAYGTAYLGQTLLFLWLSSTARLEKAGGAGS